jgi:hypothetical protein
MAVTITRTAWIDDDGSGTTGTVINNAVKTELYNQIDQGFAALDVEAGGDVTIPGNLTVTVNFFVTGAVYEQGRAIGMGHWIDIPYNAADFYSDAGTTFTVEAGDISTNAYTLIGNTCIRMVLINGASIAGTAPRYLHVRNPSGIVAARQHQNSVAFTFDGAQYRNSNVSAIIYAGGSSISVDGLTAPFAVNTNQTSVSFMLAFSIQ